MSLKDHSDDIKAFESLMKINARMHPESEPIAAQLFHAENLRDAETVPVVTEKDEHDAVNSPSHYCQGGIECIEALKAATVNLKGIEAVCTANAIKYLWRWKEKNGAVDIRKCIWYCERLLKEIENGD